jgi:hypothetical protein
VLLGHVVDELEDEHGLAHAGASEEADLAAAAVGGQEVDDLDPGLERLDLHRLLGEGGGGAVDGHVLLGGEGRAVVDGDADHVEDAPQDLLAHRHLDGLAGVLHQRAAHQPVGGVHGDAADGALAQVLGHLDDQVVGAAVDGGVGHGQGREDLGEAAAPELDVDDRADDLDHFSLSVGFHAFP